MSTPFSVIIPTHNQAPALQQHLPVILKQDYDDFEVIVVDISSTDETKDVLENLELQHPNLRHTRTPQTARDISLERLALTLGIRSARHEWIVITHADCEPATDRWLQCLNAQIKESKELLIGVAKYDESRRTWFDRKVGFFRLWNTLANIRHINGGHAAMRADGCNMALRKTTFLESDGFGSHLNLLTGAEELLANRLSKPKNTAVVVDADALVVEDRLAEHRLWKQQRVFYMETRKHQKNTFLYRTKLNMRMLSFWLLFLLAIGTYPVLLYFYPEEEMATSIIAILVLLLFLIYNIIALHNLNRFAHAIGYEHGFHITGFLFTLMLPFWNISAWISHCLAPESEFNKKFV
jgi:glycosyltransferase involved in cell wall biosynthesis